MFQSQSSIKSFNPYDCLDRNRDRKVVFYGRVSTEHEAQISALENQMQWYDEQARMHANWNVVDRYIDEGITGTQAKKRPAFLKMVEDARQRKFDLIVTREVCRFARNTVDTLLTTRELKNIGIEVYFVEDNIWTMDGDGELRLSLMATLAQEESRKVSERVKAGQQISREKATVYGSGNILGYDRCGNTYVINEEQAETVRLIYNMYINEDIGILKIANKLTQMHRTNASGIVKWGAGTVSRILNNRTYTGYMAYGKSYSNNYLEQKRVNNYDTDTYMCVKADFEPIISEEVWNRCQEIKKRRTATSYSRVTASGKQKKHGKPETKDIWVKKLQCSCGSSFRKCRWHQNKKGEWSYGYQCYNQLNNGTAKKRRDAGLDDHGYCDQGMIVDWKLELMAKTIFYEIWNNRKESIQKTLELIKNCYQDSRTEVNSKTILMNQIDKLHQKKNMLLDMRTNGELTKEEFMEQKIIINQKIENLSNKLAVEQDKESSGHALDYDSIITTLNEVIDLSKPKVDRDLLDKFVYKVVPIGKNHFRWYMNLSQQRQEDFDIEIEGRKNTAVVSIDEGDTSPSVHKDLENKFVVIKGEKSCTLSTLHRLRSKPKRTKPSGIAKGAPFGAPFALAFFWIGSPLAGRCAF